MQQNEASYLQINKNIVSVGYQNRWFKLQESLTMSFDSREEKQVFFIGERHDQCDELRGLRLLLSQLVKDKKGEQLLVLKESHDQHVQSHALQNRIIDVISDLYPGYTPSQFFVDLQKINIHQ